MNALNSKLSKYPKGEVKKTAVTNKVPVVLKLRGEEP